MSIVIILLATLGLAYANGSNDNFKGVATLFGSGTTHYRKALGWATITTFLGSIIAVFLAETLLKSFSGKGLVIPELAATAEYGAAVAFGAGLTVLLATRIGMPVSTTHSLVGALVGAGWMADSAIEFEELGSGFVIPLLVSPVLAFLVTAWMYPLFSWCRRKAGIRSEGEAKTKYVGQIAGLEAGPLLNRMHFLSAGAVSFARGLNDTPKIAALFLLTGSISQFTSTALVGLVIAVGGVISARRVAETMSKKITEMNHGQGFTANLTTSVIVIFASRLGLPVSTTHVSCGSLFGIGTVTRQAQWKVIRRILGSWLVTLPIGALLGAIAYLLVTSPVLNRAWG